MRDIYDLGVADGVEEVLAVHGVTRQKYVIQQ